MSNLPLHPLTMDMVMSEASSDTTVVEDDAVTLEEEVCGVEPDHVLSSDIREPPELIAPVDWRSFTFIYPLPKHRVPTDAAVRSVAPAEANEEVCDHIERYTKQTYGWKPDVGSYIPAERRDLGPYHLRKPYTVARQVAFMIEQHQRVAMPARPCIPLASRTSVASSVVPWVPTLCVGLSGPMKTMLIAAALVVAALNDEDIDSSQETGCKRKWTGNDDYRRDFNCRLRHEY